MKEIQKWNSRLEKFWLVIAVVSTLGSLVILVVDNLKVLSTLSLTPAYFLLSLIAWGIFLIRRGLRKRLEKNK